MLNVGWVVHLLPSSEMKIQVKFVLLTFIIPSVLQSLQYIADFPTTLKEALLLFPLSFRDLHSVFMQKCGILIIIIKNFLDEGSKKFLSLQ